MRKLLVATTWVSVLLMTVTGVALAWPDQPPDRATISGPGLNGAIEITDKDVLAALKLGVFEDLEGPRIEAPQVSSEGYTIRRWFYGGEFNFATLDYYPDPAGGNGYVRWDDGPDLTGDHTAYNGRWLRVTPRGEAAMRKLLPTNDLFFVRPDGAKGSSIVYSMPGGQRRFTLPAGMLSADGKHYLAAMLYPYPGEAATIVTLFDPGTGKPYYKFPIRGQWDLSGVSPSGRWVALTRLPGENEKQAWTKANQWRTDIHIVDSETGKTTHILSLDGNFEVETISADGNSLFLVEHLPAVNPDHYLIRLYDLSAEQLQADPLRAKGADEVMAGLAWEGVASPDGHWLLTLYLSTRRDVAFVHTLDLQNKFPVCIDLPSGNGDLDQLKYYNLALAPDGQTIYATNGVLGVVAEVDLSTGQVARTVKFTPSSPAKTTAYSPQAPTSRSVVSKDGQTVYFTSGTGVWVYDVLQGQVNGPYATDMQVLELGLSGDGKHLYVASADGTTRTIDAASIK